MTSSDVTAVCFNSEKCQGLSGSQSAFRVVVNMLEAVRGRVCQDDDASLCLSLFTPPPDPTCLSVSL